MRKLFIDTNILVDLIAYRRPFSAFAIQIFSKVEEKKLRLYTSSHSMATTYYLLKKYLAEKALREILYNLLDFIQVVPIDQDIIKKGLKSKHKNFEDALQLITAYSIENLDGLVTRNPRDFAHAEIPILTPEQVTYDWK
jgi:predicted nucleic acid-binding protein